MLYGLAIGSITGAMLVAPNALVVLEKPLNKIFKNLDDRQKKRQLIRLRSYLKTRGLVRGDYSHGIILTAKAKKRLKKLEFNTLVINKPDCWDGKWRLVMFDIPEIQRIERVSFTNKIRELGFQLLQQSVWIHPFADKETVYVVSEYCGVEEWVTFIETGHIDNSVDLEKRFKNILK